jgi:hypothetical protein
MNTNVHELPFANRTLNDLTRPWQIGFGALRDFFNDAQERTM